MKLSISCVFHLDTFSYLILYGHLCSFFFFFFQRRKKEKETLNRAGFSPHTTFEWNGISVWQFSVYSLIDSYSQKKHRSCYLIQCVKKQNNYILFSYICCPHHNRQFFFFLILNAQVQYDWLPYFLFSERASQLFCSVKHSERSLTLVKMLKLLT